MPYISVRTTEKIPAEKATSVKARLGKAIERLPGKSEEWLMAELCGDCKIWFRGDNTQPSAMIEVKIFGKTDHDSFDALTAELCRIMSEELSVPAARTYVKLEENAEWGWNGGLL